jgi:hypothetical protein
MPERDATATAAASRWCTQARKGISLDGSTANAFNALLGIASETLPDAELAELEALVAEAKARDKRK